MLEEVARVFYAAHKVLDIRMNCENSVPIFERRREGSNSSLKDGLEMG